MVDLWFLSVCVAVQLGLEPADTAKHDTRKIIDGSIFGSDPWRVHTLMLIAIGTTGDVQIVSEPRKMMALASRPRSGRTPESHRYAEGRGCRTDLEPVGCR